MSNSLQPHGLQHARLPCPSPIIGAYSFYVYQVGDAIQPAHPSPLLLLPSILAASGSFLMNQFFASGGQNTKSFSFSISPSNNIQDWFPLGLNAWISLQSKGLWRVFSNTTVQKHQFFGAQLSYRNMNVVPTDCSEAELGSINMVPTGKRKREIVSIGWSKTEGEYKDHVHQSVSPGNISAVSYMWELN